MPKTITVEAPDGRHVTLQYDDAQGPPSEEELNSIFGVSRHADVPQEPTDKSFNLNAAVDQAGNVVRSVVGGVADAGAGIVDTVTNVPRALGAPIASFQEALKAERAQEGNTYNQARLSTDLQAKDIPFLKNLEGVIGPTINPANFLGQVLGTAPLTAQALGAALPVGVGRVGTGIAAGATEGYLQGAAAPTNAQNPQQELLQRLTGGAAGAAVGSVLGGAGGAVANKLHTVPIEAATTELHLAQSYEDVARNKLDEAMKALHEHPHAETEQGFKIAKEHHDEATAELEKVRKNYEKSVQRYGLPPQEAIPEAPGAEPQPAPPIDNGQQRISSGSSIGLDNGGADFVRPALPDPRTARDNPNRPPAVQTAEGQFPAIPTGQAVPDSRSLVKSPIVTQKPPRGPLITPPPPRADIARGQAPFIHTPETLDLEIKRAIMQNALGETDQAIRETMQDIASNPEYAAYASENYARLVKEAHAELNAEIDKRYIKELESGKFLEAGDGKNYGQGQEGNNAGDSGGSENRSQDGGPQSEQGAAGTQETATEKPRGSITKLNAFPQNVIDYLAKKANPQGSIKLNDAQRSSLSLRQYQTQTGPQNPGFMGMLKEAAQNMKDEIKPAFTNRFDAIQKLGEDPKHAVNRFFGLSAEGSSYLFDLGSKVKAAVGSDPAVEKAFNEYLLLKRLEGRATANPADPMVIRRFPASSASLGGVSDIQAALRDIENDIGPRGYQEFQRLEGEVQNLVKKMQDLMVDTGIVSVEDMATLRAADPNYVKFASLSHALDDLEAMRSSSGKKLGVNSQGGLIGKVKEYTQAVHANDDRPVLDNLPDYVERIVKRVRENEVVKTSIDALGQGAIPSTGNTGLNLADWAPVSHMVDGKVVEHYIPKPIAEAIDRMTPTQAKGFGKVLQWSTRLQTGLATGYNPIFSIVQAVKDIPTALVQNTDIAAGIIKNLPKAAKESLTEAYTGEASPLLREFYESGAGGSFVGEYKNSSLLKGLSGEKELRKFDEFKPKHMVEIGAKGRFLEMISRVNTSVDNTPRVAAFKARKDALARAGASPKQIIQGAVQTGRNATVDFAEGGYLTKQINQAIPFANVAIQGPTIALKQLKKSYEANPAAFAAVVGATVVFPEVMSFWNNHRSKEVADAYDDIEPYVKNNNVIFILDTQKDEKTKKLKHVLMYPMNDSMKQIRNVASASAQLAYTQDTSEAGRAFVEGLKIVPGGQFLPVEADSEKKGVFGSGVQLSPAPILNTIPLIIKPFVEVSANRDLFRGRDILTKDQKIANEGTPEQRGQITKPQTSSAGIVLSEAIGGIAQVNPIQADYVLNSTIFSGGGSLLGNMVNLITDQIPGYKPTAPKETGIVDQFKRRFTEAATGNIDKKQAREDSEAIAQSGLKAIQKKNALRILIPIIKDETLTAEQLGQKLLEEKNKLDKLSMRDPIDFDKLIEQAAVETMYPMDDFQYRLQRMGKLDRIEAVIKRVDSLPEEQAALFLKSLEAHGISLDFGSITPKTEDNTAKPGPSNTKPIRGPISALQAKPTQEIAVLGDGLYKVTRNGKTQIVRKTATGFTVIG
jgi:Large polyvalent protein associated domain 38